MAKQIESDKSGPRLPLAVVVGASGGVGTACAHMLVRNGYETVLVGRDNEKLLALARVLTQAYNLKQPLVCYAADLREEANVQSLGELVSSSDRLEVVILSSGVTSNRTSEFDMRDVAIVWDTNFVIPLLCAKYLVPIMCRSQKPYLINMASRAGVVGFADKGIYGAAKAAVIRYFDCLRAEKQSTDLRVTSLCPGWINTQMAVLGGCPVPLDQVLQPSDIASLVEWLILSPSRVVIKNLIIEPR